MEEPQPITKQPIGDMTQQPIDTTQQPIGMPQQPIDTTQQPIAMTQQPIGMPQQPIAMTQQPIGMPQQPIGVPQQPIGGMTQQPMVMTQQPIGMVQQPAMMGTTNVVVVTQQPQQPRYRDWSTGLCGCFEDCGSCCLGLWCPSCLLTDISQRMGEGCCFACCCPNALLGLRVKIRAENNIQGSLCDDYCIAFWCSPLVACQISRELKNMGR